MRIFSLTPPVPLHRSLGKNVVALLRRVFIGLNLNPN
jgi:hypothetical protein